MSKRIWTPGMQVHKQPRRTKRDKRRERPASYEYEKRDGILMTMGFWSYRRYLRSDLWASIKAAKMDSAGWKCELCGESAQCIHHTSYSKKTLTGKNLRGMLAICRACHYHVEHDENGRKLCLIESREKSRRIFRERMGYGKGEEERDK